MNPNKQLAENIGAAARHHRRAMNLSQPEAANRVGISLEFYLRLERGLSLPSTLTLARLVAELGLDATAALTIIEDGPEPDATAGRADTAPAVQLAPEAIETVEQASSHPFYRCCGQALALGHTVECDGQLEADVVRLQELIA